MKPRIKAALPVFVGIAALGNAAASPALSFTLLGLALALWLSGPRLELDSGRQLLATLIGAGAGYLDAALVYEASAGTLGEISARLAAAALLAAAARWLILAPRGGNLPSIGLAFTGLVAAGRVEGKAYVGLAVLFLLLVLWGFGSSDPRAKPGATRSTVGLGLLLIAASLAATTTIGLRRFHAWVTHRVRSSTFIWQPQVGFSDRMDLGALDGMIESDAIVLRVRGPRVDYLRGAAFDIYESGSWRRSERAGHEQKQNYGGVPPPGAVSISAVSERTARFFLPLASGELITAPGAVSVDSLGAVKRDVKGVTAAVQFVPGPRRRAELAPPQPSDLHLPRRVRRPLQLLAEKWTQGAGTSREKLAAIQQHLRMEYRYARAFTRQAHRDPVLDFLFLDKSGHCEYFASALALTARAARIPTRAVMGYRVAERSPFGYYVVRERNAHAWVEAWLPGSGWETLDATPEEEVPQNLEHEAGYVTSLADGLSVGYDEATGWLERRTLLQTSAAWLVGLLLLALVVARGARGRKARTRRVLEDEAALPPLRRLLARLARLGHTLTPSEPLERLAARIPDPQAARLLERYGAYRYGDVGNLEQLARDVAEYEQEARRSSRSRPGI